MVASTAVTTGTWVELAGLVNSMWNSNKIRTFACVVYHSLSSNNAALGFSFHDAVTQRSLRPVALTVMQGWFDRLFPTQDNAEADADRRRQFPEQYPATYVLSDEIVQGDGQDALKVRSLLKQTQLESRPLQLVYDAQKHCWSADAFHKRVDGKGAAVVLATTRDGFTVGGYNPKGWSSLGGARPSVAAFLFCPSAAGGFQKLRKVGGGGLACANDDPNFGISFGPDALVVGLQRGRERLAQSKLGPYYEQGPDDLSSLFDGGLAELASLKILVGKYDLGEEIPYSGGVLDMTSG